MKIFIIIAIVFIFGAIGIYIKKRYENENMLYRFIKEFHQYYISNISLFKNNLVEIIDNYIIMHKNKNAKYIKIFIKNNNLYKYNEEILKNYIFKNDDVSIIYNYLNNLGKCEYIYEREKVNEFTLYLDKKLNESLLNLKNKGELYFKLLLAIGVVVSIILW